MTDLDDFDSFARLDSQDVLSTVEGFAEQCRAGWAMGRAAEGLPEGDGLDSIVVAGMGGSGSAGDLAHAATGTRIPIPLTLIRGYGPLPEWVGRNTLFVALSYSGNTEEILDAFERAHERGARLVAIASGGGLEVVAPSFGAAFIKIPSGLQPRAALGYLAMPVLAILHAVGVLPDLTEDLDESLQALGDLADAYHRKSPIERNPSKQLGARLTRRIPVVYGGGEIAAVAARRFKNNINEYAKSPAFFNEIPELNHNEIEGWAGTVDTDRFVPVFVRTHGGDVRLERRLRLTQEIVERHLGAAAEIWSIEGAPLTQLLSLVHVSDLAAVYTALAAGVDPGPVDVLEGFKKQLARLNEEGATR